jgi:hypothetical protein
MGSLAWMTDARRRYNRTTAANGAYRRFNMIDLNRLGFGGLIFLIGAAIYIINIALAWGKRRTTIPIDGVGLMVLGLGMALLLRW